MSKNFNFNELSIDQSKIKKVFFFIIILVPFFSFSQDEAKWAQFGVNIGPGISQNELKENYPGGLQIGGELLFGLARINTLVGGQYQWVYLGEDEFMNDTLTQLPNGNTADSAGTKIKKRFNIIHVAGRFMPFKEARLSPYLDFGAGMKIVGYKREDKAYYKNGTEVYNENQENNLTLSYVAGVGIMYNILSDSKAKLALDLRGSWYGSTPVDYPKDVTFDDSGNPNVDYATSQTDMLYFSIGIVIHEFSTKN